MTATAQTPLSTNRGGVRIDNAPVAGDAVNGNSCPNTGKTHLLVAGGSAGGTVAVSTTLNTDGGKLTAPTLTLTLSATQTELFGPFPVSLYGSVLNYKVSVNTVLVIPVEPSTN